MKIIIVQKQHKTYPKNGLKLIHNIFINKIIIQFQNQKSKMNSLEIFNIKDIQNIIIDYKKSNEKYEQQRDSGRFERRRANEERLFQAGSRIYFQQRQLKSQERMQERQWTRVNGRWV